jgi:hypothetical protein
MPLRPVPCREGFRQGRKQLISAISMHASVAHEERRGMRLTHAYTNMYIFTVNLALNRTYSSHAHLSICSRFPFLFKPGLLISKLCRHAWMFIMADKLELRTQTHTHTNATGTYRSDGSLRSCISELEYFVFCVCLEHFSCMWPRDRKQGRSLPIC